MRFLPPLLHRIPSRGIVSLMVALAWGGCRSDRPEPPPLAAPQSRAVAFLEREVPAWSRENGCFSCHNNGDAARALYAAALAGHRLRPAALADTTQWVRQPGRWEYNKGDPGFSDQRLADLQFAASLLAATEAGRVKETASLREAARQVAAAQDPDGAWQVEPQNPVGSPATWGTALATFMAWRILVRADAPGTHDAVQKARQWMRSARADNVPSAAVQLLAFGSEPAVESRVLVSQALSFLRAARTRDGGWGPYRHAPPEAFDTALALLALAEIREEPAVGDLIQRGRGFLLALQQPDGGWPATTRPPGGDSYAQRMSTTGWVTLALIRTRPQRE